MPCHAVRSAHESRVGALKTEHLENDERDQQYCDVQREVRHVVLRRPMILVDDDHFDSLRQKLPVPAANNTNHKLNQGRISQTDTSNSHGFTGNANNIALCPKYGIFNPRYKKLSYCRDSELRRSLRRSRSFKVIDVSTSRKPVCDYMLVNNTSLTYILSRIVFH